VRGGRWQQQRRAKNNRCGNKKCECSQRATLHCAPRDDKTADAPINGPENGNFKKEVI